MLIWRVITAIILIPIVIFLVLKLTPFAMEIIMALLMVAAAWEWTGLIPITSIYKKIIYCLGILVAIFLARDLNTTMVLVMGFIVMCWSSMALYFFQHEKTPLGFQNKSIRAVLGFLLLIPTWVAIIYLHAGTRFGPQWLLFALIIIWAADTGAYFVGRFLGKHTLAARVSPKKTWEGVAGGLLLVIIVTVIGSFCFPMNFKMRFSLWVLAIIVTLFSIAGDLMESMLKRMAGIKDTSNIFPGHGGLLDRMDSVIGGLIILALGSHLL